MAFQARTVKPSINVVQPLFDKFYCKTMHQRHCLVLHLLLYIMMVPLSDQVYKDSRDQASNEI